MSTTWSHIESTNGLHAKWSEGASETPMNPKTLALDQYARGRRRLNTRLGLVMVALIPLPAILLRARFEPLQLLAIVVAVAVGTGIVYPVWWRSKHHPYREDAREKRTRLISDLPN